MKKIIVLPFLILASCQSFQRRSETNESAQAEAQRGSEVSPTPESGQSPQISPNRREATRLGLILGPGGARAFAHVGFLKEIQSRKIPVHAIVGLEWGSLVAASFAAKGSAHEAEWQLSKFKDAGSSWLADSPLPIQNVIESLKTYLSSYSAESLRVPFGCTSLNLKKSQVYMMAKGRLDQLLPYCLAYPPQFAPYERTIAAPRDIQLAAEHLRRQGANYIVFVNVLTGVGANEALNWQELAYDMKRKHPDVSERLDIVISERTISDFKSKQDLIQLGSEQSAPFAEKLMNRF
jgi:NTE family protein